MDFEKYASDFLKGALLQDWCIINLLRYLESCVQFSSDSKNDILDAFKRVLRKTSNSSVVHAGARTKAVKLFKNVEEIFKEKKFLTFLMKLTESGRLYVIIA